MADTENAAYSVVYSTLNFLKNAIDAKSETDPVFSASPAATITAQDIINWNAKGDGTGDYIKPAGGIPRSDLAKSVTDSLDKADSSVQTVNNISPVNGNVTINIPDAVTEADILGMGFTKNTGTYIKPTGGIPESDLADTVKTKLNSAHITEADVAGWGFTKNTGTLTSEVDPVFTASPAYGIKTEDITKWNSALQEEQYKGTVTSVNNTAPDANGNVTIAIPDVSEFVTAADITSAISKAGHYTKPSTGIPDSDLASTFVKTVNNVAPVNGNVTITIPDALPAQADNAGKYLTTNGSAASWASIDLSDYIVKSGSRGDLAGYSTPTTNAEATISIDKSSPDDLVVSNATPTISIANGGAGESWLKVVSIAHAEATLTFGSQWLMPNDEIPALADNCVMSLYWNGTYGVVSMTYATEDGSGSGSALKIPEVSGQTDKVLSNNGTSLVWKDAPVPSNATATSAGLVKPDGTTITVSDGVISAVVPDELPEMSSNTSGKVLANNGENAYWMTALDEDTVNEYIAKRGARNSQYDEGDYIGGYSNVPILTGGALYGKFEYGAGGNEITGYTDGWRVFDDNGNFIVDKMTPDCVGVYDGNIIIGDNWNSYDGPWATAEGSSGGPQRFDSWMKVLYLFNPGTITVRSPGWWTIEGELEPMPHDQLVVFWNAGSGIIKLIHKE